MKSVRKFCIALLILIAVSAIYGGVMLINDSSGRSMQLSMDDLKGSPFADYAVPGWILIIAIGIGSIAAAVATWLHRKGYPYLIMGEGVFLFLWIAVQIYILEFHFLQLIVGLLGLALLLLGNLLRKNLANPPAHTQPAHTIPQKSHHHKHRKR